MEFVVKPGQWGWSFPDLLASWRLAEELGFDAVSCFDLVPNDGGQAWEPITLLGVMAAETSRVALCVHVLNTTLRNPLLAAGQLAVVQAASGGRLRIGLGIGSGAGAQYHRAAGITFPTLETRMKRLEACCRVFPQLWLGETVTDGTLELTNASLGPIDIPAPSLVVGGDSDRVLEIAVRHADAWNGQGNDVDAWARRCRRLEELHQETGRKRPITREAQVFADPFLDHDDPPGLRSHLVKLEAAGAERVVLVLHRVRGPAAVERLAGFVL